MSKKILHMPEMLDHPEFSKLGTDLSLIESSLRLTYEERIDQHQAALELMLECEEAGRRFYEQLKENS